MSEQVFKQLAERTNGDVYIGVAQTHCVPCRVRNLKTLNLGLIWSLLVLSALTAHSELSLFVSPSCL